jgi:rod shape-determining protein MreC
MRRDRFLLISIIAALVLLFIWQPSRDAYLQSYLSPGRGGDEQETLQTLKRENIALRGELDLAKMLSAATPKGAYAGEPAFVYARYPFNLKDRLLVSVGEDRGVKVGSAVLFGRFLIGQVKEVFPTTASVITLFDHSWQSAVRIGARGEEALLSGGAQPRLTFIGKDAAIARGDAVVNAASPFPFGAPIGEIASLSLSADRLTQEAELRLPYDVRELRTVLVLP